MSKWTTTDIPDQTGRRVIITGANSGLGLSTAVELARHGAAVTLACRNPAKGEQALTQVRATAASPDDVTLASLDLADLASVRSFADTVTSAGEPLDLLVNNAGIMAAPRRVTADGFESQLATNHLGHFALTGLLLDVLQRSPHPRVVTVSSLMHKIGSIKFDDLQREHRYNNWLAYGQSKLANLLFCFELQRRATAAGSPLLSLAAHPGTSNTNLKSTGPGSAIERAFLLVFNTIGAQSADMGALPSLYAATMELPGAAYIGPDGMGESRGYPKVVGAAGKAYDEAAARRLWEESERLTGVHYDFAAAAVA